MSADAARPLPPERRRTSERRRYLTVPAFAQRLCVHDDTVRKWIRAGVLPAYRFPAQVGEWRIRTSDAARFEQAGRFTLPAEAPPRPRTSA